MRCWRRPRGWLWRWVDAGVSPSLLGRSFYADNVHYVKLTGWRPSPRSRFWLRMSLWCARGGSRMSMPWWPRFRIRAIQRWHVRTMTELQARDWILSWRDHWVAESAADWAVTDSDRVVGHVGFRRIDRAAGCAGISYWTLPAARGRGVAVRAAVTASRWMFDQVGLHRIELHHSVLNEASCRVATKAGFAAEACCGPRDCMRMVGTTCMGTRGSPTTSSASPLLPRVGQLGSMVVMSMAVLARLKPSGGTPLTGEPAASVAGAMAWVGFEQGDVAAVVDGEAVVEPAGVSAVDDAAPEQVQQARVVELVDGGVVGAGFVVENERAGVAAADDFVDEVA